MIEFIKDNLAVIAVAAVVVIFLIRFGRTIVARLRLSGQIDREGVAADAVVSRVVIDRDSDGNESRITYVTFTDDAGAEQECPLAAVVTDAYEEGDRLRIRYLPGRYDLVKPVKG